MSSVLYRVEDVLKFLKTYEIIIVYRKDGKNQQFRHMVNTTINDEISFLRYDLSKEHCVKSCLVDHDYPNNYLYVFKAMFYGKRCYIKLTVVDHLHLIKVICFHEDEEALYA